MDVTGTGTKSDALLDKLTFVPPPISEAELEATDQYLETLDAADELATTAGLTKSVSDGNVLPNMGDVAAKMAGGEISRPAGLLWAKFQGVQTTLERNPEARMLCRNPLFVNLASTLADPAKLDGPGHAKERAAVRQALSDMQKALSGMAATLKPEILQMALTSLNELAASLDRLEESDASFGSMALFGGKSLVSTAKGIDEAYAYADVLVEAALALKERPLSALLADPAWSGKIDALLHHVGYSVDRTGGQVVVTSLQDPGKPLDTAAIDDRVSKALQTAAGNALATVEALRLADPTSDAQGMFVNVDSIIQQLRDGQGMDAPLGKLFAGFMTHVGGADGASDEEIRQKADVTQRLLSGEVAVGSLGDDEAFAKQLVEMGILRIENGRYVSAMSEEDTRQARQIFRSMADPSSDAGKALRQMVQKATQDRAFMQRLQVAVQAAMAQSAANATATDQPVEAGHSGDASWGTGPATVTVAALQFDDMAVSAGGAGPAAALAKGEKVAQQAVQDKLALDRLYEGQDEEFKRTLAAMDKSTPA